MHLPEQPNELIKDLNRSYELELAEDLSLNQLEALLAAKINTMILENFGALMQLLYRVDVSEAKLKQLLLVPPLAEGQNRQNAQDRQNAENDAGRIIARLIMERQWQKVETRRQHRRDPLEGTPEW